MDVYAEKSSIHAVVVGKANEEVKLAYLLSRDGGSHWNKSVIVNRKEDGPVLSRRGNDAQVSANGRRVVVAWKKGGELPESGPMLIAYSADGGTRWARGENPAVGDGMHNQSYLDLAADENGRFHLVWLDDREENGNTQGLRYARSTDGGRHWDREVTLDPKVCTCCWNRLAVLANGNVAVLYRDDEPHDMRLARAAAGGGGWRDLGRVGSFDWRFEGCPHCGGGIASSAGKNGELLHGVVWSGKDGAAGLYYLDSTDHGEHWSPPLRIGDGHSRHSDIAARGRALVVVYTGPVGDGEGVQFIRSEDGGKTWSPPRLLSAEGAVADHPRILATPAGFRAFWTEKRPGSGRVWAMQFLAS
ncbi:MAG: sialidase family protein [Methylococcaceae bacterium]|nr:sialidase family protein [Methylococcaceae bacterium]